MLRIFNLLLALVLAQGWQWARIAQENGLIAGAGIFVVAGSFVLLFLAHQLTLSIRQPADRSQVRARSAVLDNHLLSLVSRYYELHRALLKAETVPQVRANVMLPVVDRWGLRKRLQICFKGCPDWCQYGRKELDLYWDKNCGVVGWVWKCGQAEAIEMDGRENGHEALRSVPVTHTEAVADIKSILSIPILENGKPIGVLNLDGQEMFDRTLFNRNEVKELAERYAQALPSLCFPNGVKPR